ncbi:MAG: hypothetical protein KAJ46_00125 [Sedimentisphaerales bacterium]|nr:hypothetical protein [Sedimentisphaerales bacterium]
MFANFLINRCLHLTLILAALLSGCQEDPLARMRRENPFTSRDKQDPDTVLFVTCNNMSMELPGHVNVPEQPFWHPYALPIDNLLPVDGLVSGLTAEQVRTWHNNDISLALVPMSLWKTFVDNFVALGAERIPDKIALFRRPSQVAELPAYWIEQSRSVFVSGSNGAIRGYTLETGDCFFRINCVPAGKNRPVETLHIKIDLSFRLSEPIIEKPDNKTGFIKRVSDVIFKQLTLSGILRNGYFLTIAVRHNNDSRTGSLGRLFLSRTTGAENYQMVYLLAPSAHTATEIKTQKK